MSEDGVEARSAQRGRAVIVAKPIRARRRTCPRRSTSRSEGAHSALAQPLRRERGLHPSAARRRRTAIGESLQLPSRCDSSKEARAPRARAPLPLGHIRPFLRETRHGSRPPQCRAVHRHPDAVAVLHRSAPRARAHRGSRPSGEAPMSVPSSRAHPAQKRRVRRTSPDTALSMPSGEAETARAMDNSPHSAPVQAQCPSTRAGRNPDHPTVRRRVNS